MTSHTEETAFDPAGFMDPAIAADPQPFYRQARDTAAVVSGAFGPQVVRRAEAEYALQHPDEFSSAMEAVDLGQSVPLIPLQVDPPDHLKYRKLLDPIFAPRQMNRIEPDISKLVNELIDRFIDRGSCDLSQELAAPLPSSVFLRLVGLPLSELDLFLSMKDGILRPSGADLDEMKVNQRKSAQEIERYFAEAVEDRRRQPKDDLLTMFIQADVDGKRLTVDEILGICFLFILAGLDTVTDSLECFFAYLAQHPDQRRRIVADPDIIPTAVEELLRWESPVTAVPRMTTSDLDLGGCPLQHGDHVGISIGAVNTDERAMPHADVVDLTRSPNKHLAFGGGIHRCLGSHLARLELRTTLREWHQRIPEYSLAPGTELTYQVGLRQIDVLPLVFGGGMTPGGLASEAEAEGAAAWRERSVERSLREHRARALTRSDQFLRAARTLLSETGGVDFTVQEVVTRAGLSLRSFYQHFASKDELMVALFEDVIGRYVETLRQCVEQYDDPVEQLRALVTDLYRTADAVGTAGNLFPRALTLYHQRLAGTQPAEVARALDPQVRLVREIIQAGAAAGRFRADVGAEQLATIVNQTLIGVGHMNVLGTHVTGVKVDIDELWAFCLAGVRPVDSTR